jgi:hypothetical protein
MGCYCIMNSNTLSLLQQIIIERLLSSYSDAHCRWLIRIYSLLCSLFAETAIYHLPDTHLGRQLVHFVRSLLL